MKKWFDNLSAIVCSFWIGGLWITGIWTFVIFDNSSSEQVAGNLVGAIFDIMMQIGIYAGIFLLLMRFFKNGFQALNQTYFWAIVAIMSLIFAEKYGIKPEIEQIRQVAGTQDIRTSPYAESFRMWHVIASVVYMVECVLGLFVVTKRLSD